MTELVHNTQFLHSAESSGFANGGYAGGDYAGGGGDDDGVGGVEVERVTAEREQGGGGCSGVRAFHVEGAPPGLDSADLSDGVVIGGESGGGGPEASGVVRVARASGCIHKSLSIPHQPDFVDLMPECFVMAN